MARARILKLQDVHQNKGKCPWRIEFQVDDIPVSAFFRPPKEILAKIHRRDVSLISIPILCDLAAEVRPSEVTVDVRCELPKFRQIFDDAAGALLAEQDAFWKRPRFTPVPTLSGEFTMRQPEEKTLNPKRVVLGFSGGKDSIVSLFALIYAGYEVFPLLLNQGDRTWQDVRTWIPKLRKLGLNPMIAYLSTGRRKNLKERYGDWYYSSYEVGWVIAVLALCAAAIGAGVICLGIESSADHSFATFRKKRINHQYQKTTRHLMLLQRFYQRVVNSGLKIGSPIADVTDTEVLKVLLEQVPEKFQDFSSCGGSNWQSKHCGECEKCAFVYALLWGSTRGRRLAKRIFRRDLLDDVELYRPWIDPRFLPPLACIGPRREVWNALEILVETEPNKKVVRKWRESQLRHRIFLKKTKPNRNGHANKISSPLCLAVPEAAALIRKWVDG